MHGNEFILVVLVGLCLAVGAGTRAVTRNFGIPYTVVLLMIGFAVGALVDVDAEVPGHHGTLERAIAMGVAITPDLIIFVFLPALVFESAFSLEFDGFLRNLGAILVLAVPALIVCTVLTALAVHVLTAQSWAWSIPAGLVFGALISATDPVAVVAILRELGAPKRLATLVEGESLLNDGTAIVVFNVLLGLLVTSASGAEKLDITAAMLEFFKVVAGGVLVGLTLGVITSSWHSRTFNDALVEITLTVVCAYLAMVVAEGLLHVSGVIALVTAGLWMGAAGQSRISPQVLHFLHAFWELLAYIANTVIFLLVGLLLGSQFDVAGPRAFAIIGVTYVAIMAIRTLTMFAFKPLIGRVADPVDTRETLVTSWSGLRGAVSLALALVVAGRQDLPIDLRHQVLLLTAGVVFLTIVINGGTMGRVLMHFGFDRPTAGVELAQVKAAQQVLSRVHQRIAEIRQELGTVRWKEVEDELASREQALSARDVAVQDALERAPTEERAAGHWQRALSVERRAYLSQLSQGLISPRSFGRLMRELDAHRNRVDHHNLVPPATRLAVDSLVYQWLCRLWPGATFERLALLHDLSRAEANAADRVLRFLSREGIAEPEFRQAIEGTYRRYQREAKERLEDLRTHVPEMTEAIETRLAHRIELNMERQGIEELATEGSLEQAAAQPLLSEVDTRIKKLLGGRPKVELPETADLVRQAELFRDLPEDAVDEIAALTEERIYTPGTVLFEQGDRGDAVYIIARGAAHVFVDEHEHEHEKILDVLGGGDIVGEMALLSGEARSAGVRAATTLTVGVIEREPFLELLRTRPKLAEGVWQAFAMRMFENHMRSTGRMPQLGVLGRARWSKQMVLKALDESDQLTSSAPYVFVLLGTVRAGDAIYKAPSLITGARGLTLVAEDEVRLGLLPENLLADALEHSARSAAPAGG